MTVLGRIIGFSLLVAVAIGITTPPLAHAAEGPFNLVTSPLPISVSTKPGTSVTTELRVKNGSSETERLKVGVYKFSVNDQGEVKLDEGQEEDDFLSWASFSPSVFNAAPNEWKTVKMTIKVPDTASLGYYYGVGFSRASVSTPESGQSVLEGQVITFVLLEVIVPNAKRELQVAEFSSDHSVYEFLPTALKVKVKNTGNVHVAPTGSIFISRGGKTVATLSINPNQGNILPNSSRTYKTLWDDGFPVYAPKLKDGKPFNNADGTTATQLKWDLSKAANLRMGKYTAKMVLVYDNGQRDVAIEGVLSFWVIPWKLILGLLAILSLASFGLWSASRNFWRKFSKTDKRSKNK